MRSSSEDVASSEAECVAPSTSELSSPESNSSSIRIGVGAGHRALVDRRNRLRGKRYDTPPTLLVPSAPQHKLQVLLESVYVHGV